MPTLERKHECTRQRGYFSQRRSIYCGTEGSVRPLSMTTVDSSPSAEVDGFTCADTLFDIGDGILIGAASYFVVALLAFLTSNLFIQFVEGESLLFGLLTLFLLIVSLRSIVAI